MLCCSEHLQDGGIFSFHGIKVHFLFELDVERLAVVTAFKDRGVTALGKVFANLLRPRIRSLLASQDCVILLPPANPKNFKVRGFHPAELIAKKLGLPALRAKALRTLSDQRSLDATARLENLSGAFLYPELFSREVILFDDVFTTGATMAEMKRAAELAGGKVLAGWVLARRFQDFDSGQKKKA